MSDAPRRERKRYTWSDYQTWPDDECWEIIAGEAYAMSPRPSFRHQAVSVEIAALLVECFRGKPCRVLTAPMDVRLSEEDVVQPDILVVCNPEQIKPTHIEGPPSLVVEIVSVASEVRDRRDKIALYARFGVREFWIVTPFPSLVEVYVLEEGGYKIHRVSRKGDILTSKQFPDLTLDLSRVFNFPLDPAEEETETAKRPPGESRA